MNINADLVKTLRVEKNWSQDQLAGACGLTLRTIQRMESTGKSSLESVRALAAVFGIQAKDLIVGGAQGTTPFAAVRTRLSKYADFKGTATRPEYWWFFLFVMLVAAIAQIIHDSAYQIVGVTMVLPLLAAGTRRLRDSGQNGWWQLLFLVPFGCVVVFTLLAMKSREKSDRAVSIN